MAAIVAVFWFFFSVYTTSQGYTWGIVANGQEQRCGVRSEPLLSSRCRTQWGFQFLKCYLLLREKKVYFLTANTFGGMTRDWNCQTCVSSIHKLQGLTATTIIIQKCLQNLDFSWEIFIKPVIFPWISSRTILCPGPLVMILIDRALAPIHSRMTKVSLLH